MEMSLYMVGYRGIFSASKGQIISEGNYALLKFPQKNPHNNFVVFFGKSMTPQFPSEILLSIFKIGIRKILTWL